RWFRSSSRVCLGFAGIKIRSFFSLLRRRRLRRKARAGLFFFCSGQFGLSDGQQVLHSPIERQARRKVVQDKEKDQGQVLHDLLLRGIHACGGGSETRLPEHGCAHDQRERVERKIQSGNDKKRVRLREIADPEETSAAQLD